MLICTLYVYVYIIHIYIKSPPKKTPELIRYNKYATIRLGWGLVPPIEISRKPKKFRSWLATFLEFSEHLQNSKASKIFVLSTIILCFKISNIFQQHPEFLKYPKAPYREKPGKHLVVVAVVTILHWSVCLCRCAVCASSPKPVLWTIRGNLDAMAMVHDLNDTDNTWFRWKITAKMYPVATH